MSVDPTLAVPDTVAAVVSEGAEPTAAVAAVNTVELTPALEPVTLTDKNFPRRPDVGVRVDVVTTGETAAQVAGAVAVAEGTASEQANHEYDSCAADANKRSMTAYVIGPAIPSAVSLFAD